MPALHPLRGYGITDVLGAWHLYQAISGAGNTFETFPDMKKQGVIDAFEKLLPEKSTFEL